MKLGRRLGGSARHAYLWADLTSRGVVPAFPGASVVEPVRIPNPPLLVAEDNEIKHARKLALAYRSTMKAMLGRSAFYADVSARALASDTSYPSLLWAAPRLLALRIAPAAWCTFSFDVWASYAPTRYGKKRARKSMPLAPRPTWVYSAPRIEQRLEWFAWKESKYLGGQIEYCAEHLRLLDLYVKMRGRVLSAGTTSPEEIKKIVEHVLPAREYARLVRAAKAKYETRRDALDESIRRGEYIWR